MRLHRERAQEWANKCTKLALRSTDKTNIASHWNCSPMAWWHVSKTIRLLLSWTKLLTYCDTFVILLRNPPKCHHTNFVLFCLQTLVMVWIFVRLTWIQSVTSYFFLIWIVLKLKCITYRNAFIHQYIQCRYLQKLVSFLYVLGSNLRNEKGVLKTYLHVLVWLVIKGNRIIQSYNT